MSVSVCRENNHEEPPQSVFGLDRSLLQRRHRLSIETAQRSCVVISVWRTGELAFPAKNERSLKTQRISLSNRSIKTTCFITIKHLIRLTLSVNHGLNPCRCQPNPRPKHSKTAATAKQAQPDKLDKPSLFHIPCITKRRSYNSVTESTLLTEDKYKLDIQLNTIWCSFTK